MTWSATAPQGNETGKTRWRAVPFTRGKGLDLGCGPNKLFNTPHVIGVDNLKDTGLFGIQMRPDIVADVTKLDMFASRSMDFVFSSHVCEHILYDAVPAALREWVRTIKKGGYLVLYLPASGLYPDPGQPGSNPDHQWAVTYELVVNAMERVARDWDLCDYQVCDKNDEYSLFFAFKITSD